MSDSRTTGGIDGRRKGVNEGIAEMPAVVDGSIPLKDGVSGGECGRNGKRDIGTEQVTGNSEVVSVVEDIVNPSLDPTEVLVPQLGNEEDVEDDFSSAMMAPFSPILPQQLSLNTTINSGNGNEHGSLRGGQIGIFNGGIGDVGADHGAGGGSLHSSNLLPCNLRSSKLLTKPPSQLMGCTAKGGAGSASSISGPMTTSMATKKKLSATKTKPAFVNKLWSMVNDPTNQALIHWNDDGKSFIVTQREQFVHEILPKYFKHSNFASFVRQLNMYGWHKVQDVKSGSIQSNSDDRWEFSNEYFLRGREDLLTNILRQKPSASHGKDPGLGLSVNSTNGSSILVANGEEVDIGILLTELETVKYNQMAIADDLKRISKDNEMLWKENMLARERHQNQQQALEKIVKFLSSLYGTNTTRLLSDHLFHDAQQSTASMANQTTNLAMSPMQMADVIGTPSYSNGDLNMMAMQMGHQRPRLLLKHRTSTPSSTATPIATLNNNNTTTPTTTTTIAQSGSRTRPSRKSTPETTSPPPC
ncbi:stress-responsive transcription factor HSF1 Ecym_2208 [Eremothecium cymbalariae DBVPG|uniref:Heat shock transcription factor n=1 Tax=Eremothecium cymbalariae (strain CBS 270.75 / DBVPG 7215 / KCTC 17166 / NRRL Y-17582) TaxID=931890 RepID=G8JP52_ERECY|nr:Hypothetical protein Ecym_2208 [Eremothecium cymbalariae DBVPG\